jgi:hypothetical protein
MLLWIWRGIDYTNSTRWCRSGSGFSWDIRHSSTPRFPSYSSRARVHFFNHTNCILYFINIIK